jgi:hypothetical protein
MEDILPRTETGPMDCLMRTEAGQETEALLRGITPKGDIPLGTEISPHEDNLRGDTPLRTEIGQARGSPILVPEIRGRPLEDRTVGPTEISLRTDLGLGTTPSPTAGLRADPLLEAVGLALAPHGAGLAGPCPRTGPAGPPPGTPGRCTPP